MYVAVTGASGHIGRTAVDNLTQAGHRVRAIDQHRPQHDDSIEADIRDHDQLRDALNGTDAVLHLAGIPNPNHHAPHVVHNTNTTGSFNALAAAAETGIRTVCLASSINAIGGAFSRHARYDYFPVDENHPTYNEDPYSLSKWLAEQQADSITRRHENMTVASLRIHAAVTDRDAAVATIPETDPTTLVNHLWGYVRVDAVVRAAELVLHANWSGHEVFNIVADDTVLDTDSHELARRHWPHVPLTQELPGNSGFYSCAKARRILGWTHPR